jgi:ERCC4-related helicase
MNFMRGSLFCSLPGISDAPPADLTDRNNQKDINLADSVHSSNIDCLGCDKIHRSLSQMTKDQNKTKEEEKRDSQTLLPQKLREYQKEIISKVGDSNSLIILPTGAGKTVISAEIIRLKVSRNKNIIEGRKIALFIVPSRALVDQQAAALSYWTKLSVAKYQGGGRKTPTSVQFDVLVGTPSALLALQDRMDVIKWENVCICVFDEVHHTQKNHPYKTMATRIKQDNSKQNIQIIGLTASLVHDTQRENIERAVANIRQSLSIQSIIWPTENQMTSKGYCPQTPKMDKSNSRKFNVGNVPDSLLTRLITKRGTDIENLVYAVVKDMEAAAKICRAEFESPLAKKSSEWESYATSFRGKIIIEDDQDQDDKFNLFERLSELYVALRLLEDCNSQGGEELALAWIQTKNMLTRKYDVKWGVPLVKSSEQLQTFLLKYTFPRLFALKSQLLHMIAMNEKIQIEQAIVFVEMKITAEIVSEYLQQDPDIQSRSIRSNYVTAADTPRMTRDDIKQRIQEFREGCFHVLVATSVVEEGLDIPNVKVVVLFDLIHTPVVLRQRFGRARDKEPKIIVLSERHGRSVADLQQAIDFQKHVIENASDDMQPLPVDLAPDKSREKVAFTKFLLDEPKITKRPIAVLNEFKDKTKGQLKKTHCVYGSNFQCTLEYISALRTEGFKASDIGPSKKNAEHKCALKVLSLLRSALSQEFQT